MVAPSEGIQKRPDMIQRASHATTQKLFLGSSIHPSASLSRTIAKPINKAVPQTDATKLLQMELTNLAEALELRGPCPLELPDTGAASTKLGPFENPFGD
ncbi:hypothetical protein D7B24_000134 [Verticillium nonalfalfae]|uniref:Uncharacterized protein n=1 Tax=Verticillium nonalfalfae TaxID=1051616 RepID=A0A3M9YLH6_9PEZI|nr:uncharacterized protein D7B24_000134 [Verticillium nonalfalfae]RNJ61279.1 hypothetical protein D7B24_000134 [Verticillium nonalfalfae]